MTPPSPTALTALTALATLTTLTALAVLTELESSHLSGAPLSQEFWVNLASPEIPEIVRQAVLTQTRVNAVQLCQATDTHLSAKPETPKCRYLN